MAFYVGQKIVCVRAAFKHKTILSPLTRNAVYTVRDAFIAHNGMPCVRLVELPAPRVRCFGRRELFEPGYDADRFRPVVERKTDISVFTAMLTPTPESVS